MSSNIINKKSINYDNISQIEPDNVYVREIKYDIENNFEIIDNNLDTLKQNYDKSSSNNQELIKLYENISILLGYIYKKKLDFDDINALFSYEDDDFYSFNFILKSLLMVIINNYFNEENIINNDGFPDYKEIMDYYNEVITDFSQIKIEGTIGSLIKNKKNYFDELKGDIEGTTNLIDILHSEVSAYVNKYGNPLLLDNDINKLIIEILEKIKNSNSPNNAYMTMFEQSRKKINLIIVYILKILRYNKKRFQESFLIDKFNTMISNLNKKSDDTKTDIGKLFINNFYDIMTQDNISIEKDLEYKKFILKLFYYESNDDKEYDKFNKPAITKEIKENIIEDICKYHIDNYNKKENIFEVDKKTIDILFDTIQYRKFNEYDIGNLNLDIVKKYETNVTEFKNIVDKKIKNIRLYIDDYIDREFSTKDELEKILKMKNNDEFYLFIEKLKEYKNKSIKKSNFYNKINQISSKTKAKSVSEIVKEKIVYYYKKLTTDVINKNIEKLIESRSDNIALYYFIKNDLFYKDTNVTKIKNKDEIEKALNKFALGDPSDGYCINNKINKEHNHINILEISKDNINNIFNFLFIKNNVQMDDKQKFKYISGFFYYLDFIHDASKNDAPNKQSNLKNAHGLFTNLNQNLEVYMNTCNVDVDSNGNIIKIKNIKKKQINIYKNVISEKHDEMFTKVYDNLKNENKLDFEKKTTKKGDFEDRYTNLLYNLAKPTKRILKNMTDKKKYNNLSSHKNIFKRRTITRDEMSGLTKLEENIKNEKKLIKNSNIANELDPGLNSGFLTKKDWIEINKPGFKEKYNKKGYYNCKTCLYIDYPNDIIKYDKIIYYYNDDIPSRGSILIPYEKIDDNKEGYDNYEYIIYNYIPHNSHCKYYKPEYNQLKRFLKFFGDFGQVIYSVFYNEKNPIIRDIYLSADRPSLLHGAVLFKDKYSGLLYSKDNYNIIHGGERIKNDDDDDEKKEENDNDDDDDENNYIVNNLEVLLYSYNDLYSKLKKDNYITRYTNIKYNYGSTAEERELLDFINILGITPFKLNMYKIKKLKKIYIKIKKLKKIEFLGNIYDYDKGTKINNIIDNKIIIDNNSIIYKLYFENNFNGSDDDIDNIIDNIINNFKEENVDIEIDYKNVDNKILELYFDIHNIRVEELDDIIKKINQKQTGNVSETKSGVKRQRQSQQTGNVSESNVSETKSGVKRQRQSQSQQTGNVSESNVDETKSYSGVKRQSQSQQTGNVSESNVDETKSYSGVKRQRQSQSQQTGNVSESNVDETKSGVKRQRQSQSQQILQQSNGIESNKKDDSDYDSDNYFNNYDDSRSVSSVDIDNYFNNYDDSRSVSSVDSDNDDSRSVSSVDSDNDDSRSVSSVDSDNNNNDDFNGGNKNKIMEILERMKDYIDINKINDFIKKSWMFFDDENYILNKYTDDNEIEIILRNYINKNI